MTTSGERRTNRNSDASRNGNSRTTTTTTTTAFGTAGWVQLRQLGTGLVGLFSRSRRRVYLVLDELAPRLLYFKDERDLLSGADSIGEFVLSRVCFLPSETVGSSNSNNNGNAAVFFVLQDDRKWEVQTPSVEACLVWLQALAARRARSFSLTPELEGAERADDGVQQSSQLRRHSVTTVFDGAMDSGESIDQGLAVSRLSTSLHAVLLRSSRLRLKRRPTPPDSSSNGSSLSAPNQHSGKRLTFPTVVASSWRANLCNREMSGHVLDERASLSRPLGLELASPTACQQQQQQRRRWRQQQQQQPSDAKVPRIRVGEFLSIRKMGIPTMRSYSDDDDDDDDVNTVKPCAHTAPSSSSSSSSCSSSSSPVAAAAAGAGAATTSASSSLPATTNSDEASENIRNGKVGKERRRMGELSRLRELVNAQKRRLSEVSCERDELLRHVLLLREADSKEGSASLAAANRLLSVELQRLHNAYRLLEQSVADSTEGKDELARVRRDYVCALQAVAYIPLADGAAQDVVRVRLFARDQHERRLAQLLDNARKLCGSAFVDAYGFRHSFSDRALALHFAATQLNAHYSDRGDDVSAEKRRAAWTELLRNLPDGRIPLNRETRALVRGGVPDSLRANVWTLLVRQMTSELRRSHGKFYFRDLCNSQGSGAAEKAFHEQHEKQISLDLLRTVPSNVHFLTAASRGVSELKLVLRAFCLHNATLGYCQGMNFIAATALLLLSAEESFWLLVALTERILHPAYYDSCLLGAQADQEVVKELLEQHHPRLAAHLVAHDLDIATITLNWFLALFFDTLPFQSMLRLWDIILLEGPKVLFRCAVALLGVHEEEILKRTDTISIIKHVKAAVRLTFDVDGLIETAYSLAPFPTKHELRARQQAFLKVLQQRVAQRLEMRRQFVDAELRMNGENGGDNPTQASETGALLIDDVVKDPFQEQSAYVLAGNRQSGHVFRVTVAEGGACAIRALPVLFDCRALTLAVLRDDTLVFGLLSGHLALYRRDRDRDEDEWHLDWEIRLDDVALRLVHFGADDRLLAALANGSLVAIESVGRSGDATAASARLELCRIPIGTAPIADVVLLEERRLLWLAVGCKVAVVDAHTLSLLRYVYVACSASGGTATLFFERIVALAHAPTHGVFLAMAHSSLVQLWNDDHCRLLFDVALDHPHAEITTLLAVGADQIWVGTSDGHVLVYRVECESNNNSCRTAVSSVANQGSGGGGRHHLPYCAGQKLSPKTSVTSDCGASSSGYAGSVSSPHHLAARGDRPSAYYIPTISERRRDDDDGRKIGLHARPHRLSLVLDLETRRQRLASADAAAAATQTNATPPSPPRRQSASAARFGFARRPPLLKDLSTDSTGSVFSVNPTVQQQQQHHHHHQQQQQQQQLQNRHDMSPRRITLPAAGPLLLSSSSRSCFCSPSCTTLNGCWTCRDKAQKPPTAPIFTQNNNNNNTHSCCSSSVNSSRLSMAYDDYFELYEEPAAAQDDDDDDDRIYQEQKKREEEEENEVILKRRDLVQDRGPDLGQVMQQQVDGALPALTLVLVAKEKVFQVGEGLRRTLLFDQETVLTSGGRLEPMDAADASPCQSLALWRRDATSPSSSSWSRHSVLSMQPDNDARHKASRRGTRLWERLLLSTVSLSSS